jgi:LacI family transcriptional regulator
MGITIKDIAVKANVAVSTVSRALNDKFDINPKTKERILKIIKDSGYNPNNIARGLVMQKVFTIGLIIPDISNPFFAEVAVGVETRAKKLGYSVIFCNTNNDLIGEKAALTIMKGRMVDGLIVSLSNESKNEVESFRETNLPIVQIDRKITGVEYPGVFVDNIKSAYNATKYLIDLGHKKITHFAGDLQTQTGIDRLEGFKKAVKEACIREQDTMVIEGKYSVDSGKESMRELLKLEYKPTALFAASDLQAAGALYVASRAEINVPEDLSIIGHDDIDLSYLVNPNLTTMEQPKKQLGKLAVDLLLKTIGNKSSDRIINEKDIVLNTKLVIRESTQNR